MTTAPPTPWHCPTCGRQLQNPRVMTVGCHGTEMPIGECPMHRTIIPDEVVNPGRAGAASA